MSDEKLINIGAFLKLYRMSKGITQAIVAKALGDGCSTTYISQMEKDADGKCPPFGTLVEWCQILGLPLDYTVILRWAACRGSIEYSYSKDKAVQMDLLARAICLCEKAGPSIIAEAIESIDETATRHHINIEPRDTFKAAIG